MKQRIALLGSTGSIGKNTLAVVREHPDQFEVVGLAAGSNVQEMVRQIREFSPRIVSMASPEAAEQVRREAGPGVRVVCGEEGVLEVATHPGASIVVSAIVGSRGLRPTLAAIRAGKTIGLANKETLVMAGSIVMREAEKAGVSILPVDSEHSAIFQCLNGERPADVRRIILTASGGAFRDLPREALGSVTREQALTHPNWSMGAKVTIDSATMMNKGLEVIEARWLFDMPYDRIDVVIHPESIIHSMVEFRDGAVMAQLGTPDMRVPIQYALSYPERLPLPARPLDLISLGALHFRPADFSRYPCLRMAYEAGRAGGTMPAVLNAANEVAVERFLAGEIPFLAIEEVIERVLSKHVGISDPTLEEIEEADRWAREQAKACPVNPSAV
ncbi:1-deoxy-D-xylulose 5-phosphate reductoisomerase [Planifilum fulgidum]|jgi:1-deoxy-D-xylulose-5-phosphate reductoisomerase|uniref:1-deoxy-D-xylulose 5-phosphate reductoisomerase n=1 Tax=Planifilum fulgidum TaxID=201973 RepID=A0A1I2NJN0_9BACL|nr:1-deoxy-D-xylulose-5-phosphate reductoisomerase [Planifilum fulgidum]MBO2496322.1 1-deoxy-D-xylulose-5-phosphate reductoisomerase [Bacillota bacterium]MBO2531718.1 1-deoxy-D-xylulose-5-phosphate reductoisomerase [Thermoactinomycetaceae bacterium]SFG01897.1 1-deoxy-D-xylulose 5-phosphate reductoisomerase [Planifilum fulgidum]